MAEPLVVGAYASAPADLEAHPDDEATWYTLLAGIDGVTGIEVPFKGDFHPSGAAHLRALLPDSWRVYVATLPLTMGNVRRDPRYGLASDDETGRAAALGHVGAILEGVRELDDTLGRGAVRAVHLTSAPRTRQAAASASSLARSLETMASWDWHGVRLIVEHSDAPPPPLEAEKGFLSLEEEIRAVTAAREVTGHPFGQLLNWGRSAIEGRSAATAAAHLERVKAAGTLAGYFFSGTSATGGPLGGAWKDMHNPVSTYDPSSLLTPQVVAATAAGLPASAYIGVKVMDPLQSVDLKVRQLALRSTVQAVTEALRRGRR